MGDYSIYGDDGYSEGYWSDPEIDDEVESATSPVDSGEVGGEPAADLAVSCGCGKSYNQEQWLKLRFVGVQKVPGCKSLAMFDCVCGSTFSVEIK